MTKYQFRFTPPAPELNQQEATALARHRPQVCAADAHFLHHEASIRAVGDHLPHNNPPLCAVGDHVNPESKKEQVKQPPEPMQQEIVLKANQEAGFPETVDVCQFFTTRPVCDAHGRSTAPHCKHFIKPRSVEGP